MNTIEEHCDGFDGEVIVASALYSNFGQEDTALI